jgi:flavin-dependent dehydrogenase
MPVRRTKRGSERTPIEGDCDVLVCGASFAGLAVARELAGARARGGRPARVLVVDRYEIGERQTSACAAPTEWLTALRLEESIRQTFGALVLHTPGATARLRLPWTFSTFDYPALCTLLAAQNDAGFDTATVQGRAVPGRPLGDEPMRVLTDRGEVSAPLVVDALGWRRVLGQDGYQPPDAPLSRGLEVHPEGSSGELEVWIDPAIVPAGYGWSFPAGDEVRVGVGSFDPRFHVREPTVDLAERLRRDPVRYQGNWIPHRLRDAAANGVFFAGDSAGHCLPLTAEGIRTAFYFGVALGRELRQVVEGRADRETALRRHQAFSAGHGRKFEWLLHAQRLVPRLPPRLRSAAVRGLSSDRFVRWSFDHYLNIAHPSLVGLAPASNAAAAGRPRAVAA